MGVTLKIFSLDNSSGASAISEGDIFIYSCSAQLISFEVDSISKEINCAEHEYMNMSPSLIALAPLLLDKLKVPISLMGSLRIWKEPKKLVSKFFNIFVASPFAGKPLSHTQTAVRGERCPNFREAA